MSKFRLSVACAVCTGLAACVGGDGELLTEPDPVILPTTGTGTTTTQVPASTVTTGTTATGRSAATGFSSTTGASSRAGIGTGTNFSTGTNLGTAAMTLPGGAATAAVSILTLNTSNNRIGQTAGSYTAATRNVSVGAANYSSTAHTNRYGAFISSGGINQIALQRTAVANVPTTGSATYSGVGNVTYVNAPTAQSFIGTMDAKVTANFAAGTVGITMNNPNGNVEGVAYSAGGQVAITGLAITGADYASTAASSGSVTGFSGAADLNSGNQSVRAAGSFAGPNAEETGAVAVITDGSNGAAYINLIAK